MGGGHGVVFGASSQDIFKIVIVDFLHLPDCPVTNCLGKIRSGNDLVAKLLSMCTGILCSNVHFSSHVGYTVK